MDSNALLKFLKELGICFRSVWLITICLVVFLIAGITIALGVNDRKMRGPKVERRAGVVIPDTAKVKQRLDSLESFYKDLNSRVGDYADIVRNYQFDANLVLEKADDMVTQWLTISTVLVSLIIGLSVWNNYKQENSYKESVMSLKEAVEKIRREQEATAHINKIGSVMTCLNSLPDPLLTESNEARKDYVHTNLSLMFDEFAAFVKLVSEDADVITDMRYLQLVLSLLKISVLRAQGVYSDITSNLIFYTFSNKLDKLIEAINSSNVSYKNVVNKLSEILVEFSKFQMELKR